MVHFFSERYIITDEIPGSAGMKIPFNIKNQKLRFSPQTNGVIIHINFRSTHFKPVFSSYTP